MPVVAVTVFALTVTTAATILTAFAVAATIVASAIFTLTVATAAAILTAFTVAAAVMAGAIFTLAKRLVHSTFAAVFAEALPTVVDLLYWLFDFAKEQF